MKTITFTDEEWKEIQSSLEDKKRGVWSDDSWPIHFAYLIADIIEENENKERDP